MSNDKFKNSPIHDKKAIIEMMDELEPKDMIEVVELLKSKQKKHNKQQSSVEWLHDELFKSFEKFYTLQFTMEEYQENNVKLYLQAQAMHKKEIVDACKSSITSCGMGHIFIELPEQYYNETYGEANQ